LLGVSFFSQEKRLSVVAKNKVYKAFILIDFLSSPPPFSPSPKGRGRESAKGRKEGSTRIKMFVINTWILRKYNES